MKNLNSKYKFQIFKIIFFLLIIQSVSIGQENTTDKETFTDKRDGKKYELLEVNELIWFVEDLQYETEASHKLDREGKTDKYFYTNNQLDSLCPYPFRIPTAEEWEKAITELYDVRKTTRKKVKYNNSTLFLMDMDSTFYVKKNLNIEQSGWVQGNKHVEMNSTTYWINEKGKLNYHIHFWEEGFSEHTHKKNILGKKKKRRKFLARCVCEKK